MKEIDFWRLSDELTIIQATLLICGIDPAGREFDIERQSKRPKGYDAIKHALLSSYRNKSLVGKEVRELDERTGDSYIDENSTLITVNSLKEWLKGRGFQEHFFFFPDEPQGEFLDPNHPRYAPKLAAAIKAWQALDDPGLIKGTAKQSVQKWLRLNASEFDLSADDGKPKETAIEEISKIVNWQPKGGAPSTPTGKLAIKKTKPSVNLSVKEENKDLLPDNSAFDLDEDIPF